MLSREYLKVIVKTNMRENTLTVEAKHKDDETKFEYLRKITLPKGVVCEGKQKFQLKQTRSPYYMKRSTYKNHKSEK